MKANHKITVTAVARIVLGALTIIVSGNADQAARWNAARSRVASWPRGSNAANVIAARGASLEIPSCPHTVCYAARALIRSLATRCILGVAASGTITFSAN